ncbi:unnamed protein product [Tetraodon nigroviridis]|uniref:(spotted green pufferfish) hypothetical protein n=1 Tax=Tetraodon nigroviridis TaxID=99883 RepID=Q4SA02_TETNG|nr:unnamed protein product [Tetraodon nigroviridis]
MRRVTLFINGTSKNGKAMYGTLSDLLSVASNKLGIKASSLYNAKGGLIDDIALIRDDDVLYVSGGDPFIDPQSDRTPRHQQGSHTDWLTLNIGGRPFTTTRYPPSPSQGLSALTSCSVFRSTLVSKEPDSMLANMFRQMDVWGNKRDERGAYLIDRSPEYFEPILNYLRHGQLIINEGVNLRELAASGGPLAHLPQRAGALPAGHAHKVGAPLSGAQLQRRRSVPPGPPLHQLQDGQPQPLQPDARQPVLLQPGTGRSVRRQPGRE